MEIERIDEHTRIAKDGSRQWTVKRRTEVDLWDILTDKGPVPKFLEGSFTTPSHAFDRIKNYVESQPKKV